MRKLSQNTYTIIFPADRCVFGYFVQGLMVAAHSLTIVLFRNGVMNPSFILSKGNQPMQLEVLDRVPSHVHFLMEYKAM